MTRCKWFVFLVMVALGMAVPMFGQSSSVTAGTTSSSSGKVDADVVTGDSTTSAFRVFNSGNTQLLKVNGAGDLIVGSGTGALYGTGDRFYFYENANDNTLLTVDNPNTGTGTLAGLRSQSDVSTTLLASYGSARPFTLFGVASGIGWSELVMSRGNGFAVGTWNSAPLILGTANVDRIHIAPDGNIGIGTATPTGQLHLYSNATADTFMGFGTDLTNGPAMNIGYAGNSYGRSAGFINVRADASATAPNPSLRFATANTQRMIITNLGRVGIGTLAPTEMLEVKGNMYMSLDDGAFYVDANGYKRFGFVKNSGMNTEMRYDATIDFRVRRATSGPLGFPTASDVVMTFSQAGNVGIGSVAPTAKFEVSGVATETAGGRRVARLWDETNSAAGVGAGLGLNGKYSAAGASTEFANIKGVKATATDGDTTGNLVLSVSRASNAGGTEVVRVTPTGIAVTGNANFTGTVTGGSIQATYQDVAEWVPANQDLTAGTVVVLNPERSNEVMASTMPYDTTVAGVVSDQPGLILGIGSATKEKIATTGRVHVRVDAHRAPIAIGDLLVTSDVPGVAMRSMPIDVAGISMHRPGTIVGKALEPLASGEGEILVLLSLQ
jgi:hypothetical protein